MRDTILRMLDETVEGCVNACISDEQVPEEWDIKALNDMILPIIPMEHIAISEDEIKKIKKKDLIERLQKRSLEIYEAKETEFVQPEDFREVERIVLLKAIDTRWMNHIDDMDQLRQSTGLQSYAQRNPIDSYKMQGFDMFQEMTDGIAEDTIRMLLRVQVERKVEREQVAKESGTNKDDSVVNAPKRRVAKKILPNDPCPCGSGKKYKFCCKASGKYET
jgi:preprotein translocase subunit SecA